MAASASSHACVSPIATCIPSSSSKFSSSSSSSSSYCSWLTLSSPQRVGSNKRWGCRAMVQQAVQGAPAAYAKEMERLSAKESLLLAFKDAGGFEALVSGKTTEWQKIDVNERITGLERLNPTPRPTTSPFLEGRWNFEWFGSGSPGLFAARVGGEICQKTNGLGQERSELGKMQRVWLKYESSVKVWLGNGGAEIENKVILSTKLSVEGPLRMKEEYVEGVFVTPTIIEERVPEQLKGALGQAANALQQLPAPIRDPVASGLKVPLSKLLLIFYTPRLNKSSD
ncbi:hypothetical protein JHK87_024684 [Glycine soja]|nr:hypothetical protein JHK87_024684 [Glycine soja]